ncbi:MAG: isoprenylcysteine carboxylmethyltransferase family protein [Actinobacteria bacterium]|nr:isoprenylcysteine carboxylmethyltransferase family protein [Actinomycetota bacterium]
MRRSTVGWILVGGQVLLFVVLVVLPWRPPTVLGIVVGGALVLAGVALALIAARGLGGALTPTPVPIAGAGLRTTGAYRLVRHPIYSALLLATLGLLVAAGTVWGWAWGVVIVVFFTAKSRWEDSLLREEYGPQWDAWAATTGGLVPKPPRREDRA